MVDVNVSGTPFYIKPYSAKSIIPIKIHPHSPSLDQIEPSGGYTIDNVQIVCDQVNKFKGDRHITSMIIIAKNLLNEYERRNTPIIKIKIICKTLLFRHYMVKCYIC